MSAVHHVTCQTCKGRGFLVMYVSEWAETKERFVDAVKRIIAVFRRKP